MTDTDTTTPERAGALASEYDPLVLAKLAQARSLENGVLLTLAEIETLLTAAAEAARARSLDASPVGKAIAAALDATADQRTTVHAAAGRSASEAITAGRMLGLPVPTAYADWRMAVIDHQEP